MCQIDWAPFGFQRQRAPNLGVALWPIHLVTRKAAGLESAQNKRRLLTGQATMGAGLRSGHVIRRIQRCLKHQRHTGMLSGASGG